MNGTKGKTTLKHNTNVGKILRKCWSTLHVKCKNAKSTKSKDLPAALGLWLEAAQRPGGPSLMHARNTAGESVG